MSFFHSICTYIIQILTVGLSYLLQVFFQSTIFPFFLISFIRHMEVLHFYVNICQSSFLCDFFNDF